MSIEHRGRKPAAMNEQNGKVADAVIEAGFCTTSRHGNRRTRLSVPIITLPGISLPGFVSSLHMGVAKAPVCNVNFPAFAPGEPRRKINTLGAPRHYLGDN